MASVGSMLTSLLPPASTATFRSHASFAPVLAVLAADAPNPLALRNKHVMILSLTGTIARLLVGIAADLLCPPPTAVPAPPSNDPNAPAHVFVQKKRIWLRRSSFAVLAIVALAAVCAYAAGVLQSEEGLWVVSAGTGSLYGTIFTLTASPKDRTTIERDADLDSLRSFRRTLDQPTSVSHGAWSRTLPPSALSSFQ